MIYLNTHVSSASMYIIITPEHGNAYHITGLCGGSHRSPIDSHYKGTAMQNFDVLFVFSLIKLLKKLAGCHWFETPLTHWGRVTHICVNKLTIIGSDNGLSPGRRQAIVWTNAGILLIGPMRTNFSEIIVGIQTFSFRKMHLKMSSAL